MSELNRLFVVEEKRKLIINLAAHESIKQTI